MNWKKWLQGVGGICCLGIMFLLVQGMMFIGPDAKDTILHSSGNVTDGGETSKPDSDTGEANSDGKESMAGTKKIAYLTFDDGPSVLTAEYLKILKEEEVRATFFLIGQQVEGDLLDVVKQEISEGHEVGMHTYCHVAEEIYSSGESYCKDLQKTRLCLEEKLNIKPKLFRFPWGSANAYVQSYKAGVIEQMKEQGIDYVDWNVSGEDSVGCPSPDSILANIRKDYVKYNDPVILLHDSAACKATLYSLRPLIQELKKNGYTFATLSERKRPCHFGE
ncbi:MAG: polysaccharide deacetylase [Lachnospiraceae bacterium]|nr:polysaccharide deacetylase [Lachnospiraceae bacterium]